jgi:Nucleotide modification associated domain 1
MEALENLQMTTAEQYDHAMISCRNIFEKKTIDYGNSWRVLRTISIVDQIFIKAKRIRTIQLNKTQKVADDIMGEFRGIVNYAIIGLIQLDVSEEAVNELTPEATLRLYDERAAMARALMLNKNHDYGEAWRDMSQESFVDLILTKLLRIKQILSNEGKTLISEGIDANYFDIINYAIFALITG